MKEAILEMLAELRPEFDFTDSDDFVMDGLLDSFDIISLTSMIEEKYSIKIDGLDIVPEIFAHPDFELAQLTGLIVKPDPKEAGPASRKIETAPVLDRWTRPDDNSAGSETAAVSEPEPDSAFAEGPIT